MTFSSCLNEEDRKLVLDASVVINLLATGQPAAILQALSIPITVTHNVVVEIERGALNGHPEKALLSELIAGGSLRVEELDEAALELFVALVSGDTASTLGDGEAATLAMAQTRKISAGIDEKKATRIATERFCSLRLVTTLDILAHHAVAGSLGDAVLSDAVLRALTRTRMQVREHQFGWVADLIGLENVETCPSLKRHAKRQSVQA